MFSSSYYVVKLKDNRSPPRFIQTLGGYYLSDFYDHMYKVKKDIELNCKNACFYGAPAYCDHHAEVWCTDKKDVLFLKTKYDVVSITEPHNSVYNNK